MQGKVAKTRSLLSDDSRRHPGSDGSNFQGKPNSRLLQFPGYAVPMIARKRPSVQILGRAALVSDSTRAILTRAIMPRTL